MPLTSSARQIYLSKRTRRADGRRFRVGPIAVIILLQQNSADAFAVRRTYDERMDMSVEGIVALASLPIPVLAALFWNARVYLLYRLLGERVGNFSYYWFSFQFQTPHLARLLPGYGDLFSSLPEDLAAQVSIVRRDMKRAEMIMACWMLLIVTLIGLSFRR